MEDAAGRFGMVPANKRVFKQDDVNNIQSYTANLPYENYNNLSPEDLQNKLQHLNSAIVSISTAIQNFNKEGK